MVGPDSTEYPVKGVLHDILLPERIVTRNEFNEGVETVINADGPQGIVVTATFRALGNQTKVTFLILQTTADDRFTK